MQLQAVQLSSNHPYLTNVQRSLLLNKIYIDWSEEMVILYATPIYKLSGSDISETQRTYEINPKDGKKREITEYALEASDSLVFLDSAGGFVGENQLTVNSGGVITAWNGNTQHANVGRMVGKEFYRFALGNLIETATLVATALGKNLNQLNNTEYLQGICQMAVMEMEQKGRFNFD